MSGVRASSTSTLSASSTIANCSPRKRSRRRTPAPVSASICMAIARGFPPSTKRSRR
jgi:hypothetical protein